MIQLDDILAIKGAHLFGSPVTVEFSDFCFDSRRIEPDQLFLAVRTDKGDGHDYILDAVRGGASGVLCQEPRGLDGHHVTCIVVPNTEAALVDWARTVLRRYGTEVIAVTGSVGKTGVKEAIAAVLGIQFPVFRNRDSFNGLFGLPIALGRLLPTHRLAVLELGSDHHGEIAALAAVTQPRIGVVTSVSAAHLEALESLEHIAHEKGALIRALPEEPVGLAILNWDDQLVREMRLGCTARVVTLGSQQGADWLGEGVRTGLDGTTFSILSGVQRNEIRIPWLGRHRMFAAMTAFVLGHEYGIPNDQIMQALAELPWLPGRLNALPALNGATLLDDTFNSSPAAARAALDLLAEARATGRKIAVLGDMYQLGERAVTYHREIGRYAAQSADRIVVKGELATEIGRGAEEAGFLPEHVRYSYSVDDVVRHLTLTNPAANSCSPEWPVKQGDLVLVKGSALTRLERVSRALLAEPERDSHKLVRQHPVFGQVVLALPGRPTWVEIDTEATANNVRQVRELIGPHVRLMIVIKADAYGHGASRIARVALSNGGDQIGVASLNEAISLRDAGISAPILVLGFSPAWTARQALLNNVSVTIYDLEIARAFDRAAAELHRRAIVHVKVDTGMGRLGLLPPKVPVFLQQLLSLSSIELEGVFTHFSVADSAEPRHREHTDMQFEHFRTLLAELHSMGLRPPVVHCANSAAILTRPETYFDMVRLGIALHGLDPSADVPCPSAFRRSLSFKTTVAQVKCYPPGTPISYGNTYTTERQQCIAVIPVGYADGFRRAPHHWGEVLVRGRRAKIVGRVTMDQTMIDVTDIPGVRVGDEVVLIGRQGDDEITAEEVADRLGTINYEVVSGILARVPRIA